MRHSWIRTGAVVLALAVVASCSGGEEGSSTATAQPVESGTDAAGASAEDVAMGFLHARSAFEAVQAMMYFSDDALTQMWDTPEAFRLELALLKAQGYQEIVIGCEPMGNTGSGVRCDYDFHGIRSDEIGLGPYSDNHWEFAVRDGKIIAAANEIAYETNGFSDQMWEPFATWVAANYPDDVPKMYEHPGAFRLSVESVQLWEQRTLEYAQENAPSPTPVTSR